MDYEGREIDKRLSELYDKKSHLEYEIHQIKEEARKTGRKLKVEEEQRLVEIEYQLMENEVSLNICGAKNRRIDENKRYENETKGPINSSRHKKALKAIEEELQKHELAQNTLHDTKEKSKLILDLDERKYNYDKILEEFNYFEDSEEIYTFIRAIRESNKFDPKMHEDKEQQELFQSLMEDKEFSNLLQTADDINDNYYYHVDREDDKSAGELKTTIKDLKSLTNTSIYGEEYSYFDHNNLAEYEENINNILEKERFRLYAFENRYENQVKSRERSGYSNAKSVSTYSYMYEQIEKNHHMSVDDQEALRKSFTLVAKEEIIDKLIEYMNSYITKKAEIGNYDFTELHEQTKGYIEQLKQYKAKIKQQLQEIGYYDINKKEDNERISEMDEFKEDIESKKEQTIQEPIDKPYHRYNEDGDIEILSSYEETPKYEVEENNNELDDMFAEDKLSNLPDNMTRDMVAVASDILFRNGMVESNDLSVLSSEDMDKAIEYAKKVQTFKGMSEYEVAEQMVSDPWIDENGREHKKEEITQPDVLAQQEVNRRHNVYNTINEVYGFNEERSITM